MDNDELADGYGMVAGIIPAYESLPTQEEIDAAIEAYNGLTNTPRTDSVESANGSGDSDLDGVPDSLEEHWASSTGASSSNPNDAALTIDFLTNNVYTQEGVMEQVRDLRLGSTMYEINEGLAHFNIVLEQSSDLTEWHHYGSYDLELSNEDDTNAQFYRFKMSD